MPALAAGALSAAAFGAGASAAVAGALGSIAYIGTYAALSHALNKAAESLARKGKRGGGGLEVSQIDSASAGRVIYGKVRVGGVNCIPPLTSGASGQYLHQVLALAVHECDGFSGCDVYLDDKQVTAANITAISGVANDGLVTGGDFSGDAWLKRYAGTTTQNVDYHLNNYFSSSFTSAHRGRGIAYLAAMLDWGKGKKFTGGVPVITTEIRGKKCYDPRLDITPGASPTNPSYIAWTQCPALIWADYKMSATYGQKATSAEIDWDCVVAAANVCDALVNIPGATTQARYTFNGVLMTDADTSENERLIIDSMLGKRSYTDGKWRIFAGAWRAVAYEIDKEDWISIGAIRTTAPRGEDRFNGVVVYHTDSARNWQRVESYRRYNDTYKSADGNERVWVELEQPACLSKYEAERKGEFLLRQSRNGIMLTGVLPPRFMRLRTWDNVSLYFDDMGWTAKTFAVASCSVRADGAVEVTLIEEQSGDWTDLAAGDYGSPSASVIPTTNPTVPSEVPSLTLSGLPGTIMASWTEPLIRPNNTRYRLIMANSQGNAAIGTVAWDGNINNANIYVSDPTTRFFWVQAYANSYYSAYTPNTLGSLGRALPVDDSTFSQRVIVDEEFQYDAGSKHWFINTPGLTSASSSFIVFNSGLSADRGVLRNRFSSTNSLSITVQTPKRTPPQTFVANQCYGFAVRFMKATSVTSGRIILYALGVNSARAYDPSNFLDGASQAPRADIKDIVSIELSALTGSYWYVAQGHILTPNSSFPGFPFFGSRLQVEGKNGDIDVDRVALWVANSTAGAGSYYIL